VILFQARNLKELIKNNQELWFNDSALSLKFNSELSNNNLFDFLRRTRGKIEIEYQIANMGFGVPSQINYVFDVINEQKFIESINYEFEKYRYRKKKIAYFFKSVFSPSAISNYASINSEMSSDGKKYEVKTMSSFCNQILLKIVVGRGKEIYNEIYATLDAIVGYKIDRKNVNEFGNELFSTLLCLEYVAAKNLFPIQSDLIVTTSLEELLKVQPELYNQVRANYMGSIKKSYLTGNSIIDEIIATFLMNIQSDKKEFEVKNPSLPSTVSALDITLTSNIILTLVGFWKNVKDHP